MVIDRGQPHQHDVVLAQIDAAVGSELWEGRLTVVELVRGLLRDLPDEATVERLVEVLDVLAGDAKWEVRKAVVPVLVDAGRPAARGVIERLTGDSNKWVRQAAERAKRKLARVTTTGDKRDRRARFAFDAVKDLEGRSPEKIYEAALAVGEKYYEELAGDTAHELNTYRAAMEGLLQELEHRLGDGDGAGNGTGPGPEVGEVLGKIRDRSRYLKTLVSGLLEYSRDAELDFQRQALAPIVADALELAQAKARARTGDQQVEEVVDVPAEVELEVCRGRFVQALVNVLSNAFESLAGSDAGARLEIAVETTDARLKLRVTDTGAGMDAAQVESATKRFRSLKKRHGGIGLGLPLALKIIEREHGGRLDIDSTLGAGTTVTIDVPLVQGGP